jgi:hypothetical protein
MKYIVNAFFISFALAGIAMSADATDNKAGKLPATQNGGDTIKQEPATISSAPVSGSDFELIAQRADKFLSANNGMGGVRTIFAQALMEGSAGPAKDKKISDYYLLDIRPPADYVAGHIKGAVNVPLGDVAKPEALTKFPKNKPILVICHTGHTASIATALLDLLGYDA